MSYSEEKDEKLWAVYWAAHEACCDYRATLPAKKEEWSEKQRSRWEHLRAVEASALSDYTRYTERS